MIWLGIIGILAGFFCTVMILDCNRFVIRDYHIYSEKILRDETLLLISDLHSKSFGKNSCKLIRAIEEIKPDRILVPGDMYTAKVGENTQTAMKLLREAAQTYPIYYSNGNHEQKTQDLPDVFGTMYEEYTKALQDSGIHYLNNISTSIPNNNMKIYGISVDRSYYGKLHFPTMTEDYPQTLLGTVDRDKFNILLAHNPDYFSAYAKWGADLVVSGHIHGGLMRLPGLGGVISPTLRIFPKYDGGIFTHQHSTMIVGRGLGTHTLPIRIFNPGELVKIRCHKVDGLK